MELIPAIDIMEGKCVRLTRGDFKSKKVYRTGPLKTALAFQGAGFHKLHLIDLDGAKEGKIINWETIKSIAKIPGLLIEFGGGVNGQEDIKNLLSLGIDKIIIGSLVLKNPRNFKNILRKFKDKIIVAADIKGNKIYYCGWQGFIKKEIGRFLEELKKMNVRRIIITDIARDGLLRGPNFSLYERLVKTHPNLEIIASGGISNIEDVKKLAKTKVAGAIIGKAIYENKISLNNLKSIMLKNTDIEKSINWKKLKGLLPVITQDWKTSRVLMLGFMNKKALKKTLKEGKVTYWSRIRKKLWTKGETSGNYQTVKEIFLDCDNDTILIKVKQTGKVCHTGRSTCFLRKIYGAK